MTLRVFGIILFLALGILSVPLVSVAQQTANVPRLGYISPGDIPRYDNALTSRPPKRSVSPSPSRSCCAPTR